MWVMRCRTIAALVLLMSLAGCISQDDDPDTPEATKPASKPYRSCTVFDSNATSCSASGNICTTGVCVGCPQRRGDDECVLHDVVRVCLSTEECYEQHGRP